MNSLLESQPNDKGTSVNETPDLLLYPFTDTGNAERLVAMFGDQIRYCVEWRKWLVWDGMRWKPDKSGEIRRKAKVVVRTFYTQTAEISDSKIREKAEYHARNSESAKGIKAMLTCTESEPDIAVNVSELDADPWLLNCRNGTVDLRTGTLLTHRQADLITKLCPVKYDEHAACPRLLRFLDRVFGGNKELIAYLQRAVGYSLTGIVSEKACFCFFGDGNNGKTTLLELLRYILGDYAAQVMIESLTRRTQESTASLADLADLRGARFVTTSETEEGQYLAEGKLKQLTGMGEVKTCQKYQNPITFAPNHKIFLDANHRPVVTGTDAAIWRRLKPIPFTVTIPEDEIDKGLLSKLKAEASGVLAWAVNGCLDWQKGGLREPREIGESLETWQREDDPYREFFEDCCEFDSAASTPVAEVWQRFEEWAKQNGIKYPSRTRLYARLRALGCVKDVQRRQLLRKASLNPDHAVDPRTYTGGRQFRCWRGVKLI